MFTNFKDLEIIAASVTKIFSRFVRNARVGMIALTLLAIISRSLKLVCISLNQYFIKVSSNGAST